MENDNRFSKIAHDNRFRAIRQKQRKVKIDSRFQSMFTDKRFKLDYKVDKRGKPSQENSSENLKKYYRISKKDKIQIKEERIKNRRRLSKLLEKNSDNIKTEKEIIDHKSNSEDESSDVSSSEEELDLARGEGTIESSSDEDDEYFEENLPDKHWSELDIDAERTSNTSRRLALCNMDWDRIRALDLYVLFNSFTSNGKIKEVVIYPSDFGIERIKDEDLNGPKELKEEFNDNEKNDGFNQKEGERFQTEKLRLYQINRLKYYYAVVDCDSVETASHIYNECDGLEYEGSSNKIDLRFIPDDMTFDDRDPKEKADTLPDKDFYKPSDFVTTALKQSKVELTWDETDKNRLTMTMRKFNDEDLENMDMKDFLASSSGESEEEENEKEETLGLRKIGISSRTTDADQIARYRSLLLEGPDGIGSEDDKNNVDMEITWEPDLLNNKKDDEENNESGSDVETNNNEILVEDKNVDLNSKAQLEMLLMDNGSKKHFNMDAIVKNQQKSEKKKRKEKKNDENIVTDDFNLDVKDSRFSAMFTSADYFLDPNNPSFRKTTAMKQLLEERQNQNKLKQIGSKVKTIEPETQCKNDSLSSLVNSVKSKTKFNFAKKSGKSKKDK